MRTICIAEDNDLDQRIIRLTIARYFSFMHVLFFGEGLSLLNYIKCNGKDPQRLPDLILLDLSMSVLDGWDFLAEFNDIKYSFAKCIQIYIVSVSILPVEVMKAKQYEFVKDFISKPLSKEKLGAIIGQELLAPKY